MLVRVVCCAAVLLTASGLAPAAAAGPAGRVLIEWRFDRASDLLGWQPNGHLRDVRIEGGALQAEAINWDPFLTSPVFDIPAEPWQWIEIEIRASRGGRGEVFWSNTLQSEHGGFFPGKETGFDVPGDGRWHTVRVTPFWHAEKRIVHLRLDLYDAATFSIRAVRIMAPAGESRGVAKTAWDFRRGVQGWIPVEGVAAPVRTAGGIAVEVQGRSALLRSPLLSLPVDDYLWVAVRMRAARAERAALVWVSDRGVGLREMAFPLRRDGRLHTYNLDVGGDPGWVGRLLALGLRPSLTPRDRVEIQWLRIERDAVGGPDLEVTFFGLEDAINRVGRPCRLVARILNHGAHPAEGIVPRLSVPPGVTARLDPKEGLPRRLEFQIPGELRYIVTARRPVDGVATLRLAGPGAPPGSVTGRIRITPRPRVAVAGQVPPPRPARTRYQVGTFYFPGWDSGTKWECIHRIAPIRKPVLGYYDEANPECADWQIKWAVEHGVTFFLVDWYWSAGQRALDHWLHRAYMRSRYRRHLKWAVMWANHNAPNTHSERDWREVTRYWIEHYFHMPEYLRIGGKPAVFIWAPGNIRRDLGGSPAAARLLRLSQEMAQDAGLPGITFAAMNEGGAPGEARLLAEEGYSHHTTYHWWADAPQLAADWRHFPFSSVVARSRQGWEERRAAVEAGGLRYIPTADTGWDSRPWHGDGAQVIYGRTPGQFELLLRQARSYLDAHGERMLILGPCNEWGEGSYIEPCAEYGFAMYDAIRRVFCDEPERHTDLAPVDVGLGPYDLPMAPTSGRHEWLFDKEGDSQGWGAFMGLSSVSVQGGCLRGTTTSADPAFQSSALRLRASQFSKLAVRMKVVSPAGDPGSLQMFWSTATQATSEVSSVRAPLKPDGRFHTYVLALDKNPRWRGVIHGLRFDPCSAAGAGVWVDYIRLVPATPSAAGRRS